MEFHFVITAVSIWLLKEHLCYTVIHSTKLVYNITFSTISIGQDSLA